ncbi:MAG: hypothetical protein AABZ47_03960 [Planctomycetota bacterium]
MSQVSTRPSKQNTHTTSEAYLRPDVGTQAQLRKKQPPKTNGYDSSLSPNVSWDGGPAHELAH